MTPAPPQGWLSKSEAQALIAVSAPNAPQNYKFRNIRSGRARQTHPHHGTRPPPLHQRSRPPARDRATPLHHLRRPGFRLYRAGQAKSPRDWTTRWQQGWQSLPPQEQTTATSGQDPANLCALKTSPIWSRISRSGILVYTNHKQK